MIVGSLEDNRKISMGVEGPFADACLTRRRVMGILVSSVRWKEFEIKEPLGGKIIELS